MTGGRSGLVVDVPAAESTVAQHRLRLDPLASLGVPAHVTVLFPFVPVERLDEGVHDRVAAIAGSVETFSYRFSTPAWFGDDVVYLAPEPPEPFVRLTELLWAAFPDQPPYGGAFDEVIPHLTIGHGNDRAALQRAEASVLSQLPVEGRAERLTLLVEGEGGRWTVDRRFSLGA